MKQHNLRRAIGRVAVVSTAVAALVGSYGMASAGAATNSGAATITDPANAQAPLASGSAAKLFSVTLPANAACPGDTTNNGYHVFSFLVHSGTDVGTLSYANFVSSGVSQGYGLIDNSGTLYGLASTATTTGQVIGIPNNFQWAGLTSSDGLTLPLSEVLYGAGNTTGTWDTGLACADTNGVVTNYWTTSVTFTASNSDPSGFTWAAVPGVPSGTPEVPLPVVLPLVALAIVGGAIGRNRRRQRRTAVATLPI